MSFRYGFYNSVNGDRKYDAVDFGRIFDGVINDGVFATIGKGMATQAGDGMTVIVGYGKAWFEHTWSWLDADLPIVISTANSVYSRTDAIILETNPDTRVNAIKVVEGTASSAHPKPTLTSHQHALAYITVRAGTTEILSGDIEVVVGTSETPFVAGALQLINLDPVIESYTNKWGQDFQSWFTHLQNELDEHQAAHLQNQIDHLEEFHIGDLLMTKNSHLSDDWILANGQIVSALSYPNLAEHYTPGTYGLTSGGDQGIKYNMARIENGKLIMCGNRYRVNDHYNYMIVADINSNPPVARSVTGPSEYDSGDDHFFFVTYDDIRRKYVALQTSSSQYSPYGQGAIYEADDIMAIESASGWGSPVVKYPYNEDADSYRTTDFIFYQGYYFAVLNSSIIRTNNYASLSWETVLTDQKLTDGKFCILDNKLYIFGECDDSTGTFTMWVLSAPGGAVSELVYNNVPSEDRDAVGAIDKFIKVNGHIYGYSSVRREGRPVFEFIFANGTIQSISKKTIQSAPGKLVGLSENTDYYWAAFYKQTTPFSGFVYRQDKQSHSEIDFSNISEWEKVYETPSIENSAYRFRGILAVNDLQIFTFPYCSTFNSTEHSNYINVVQTDAIQVTTVPTIATGFSNYIKGK